MIGMICREEEPEGIGLLFPPWEILRRAFPSPHNRSGGYPELVSSNAEKTAFFLKTEFVKKKILHVIIFNLNYHVNNEESENIFFQNC
jgi:hypothetical protein